MFATSTIAQRIRYMIARQRQRQLRNHAVQTALAGALGYHPEFRDTGFDAHFIRHRAAKTIAPYIQHGDAPDVAALTAAWVGQFTFGEAGRRRALDHITPMVNDFVHLLMSEERGAELLHAQQECLANGSRVVPQLSH